MNFSGLNDAQLDTDTRSSLAPPPISPRARTTTRSPTQRLAALLPAIPLFQQVIVNTYSSSLLGVVQNDLVPDFNTAAWYCTDGNCAG